MKVQSKIGVRGWLFLGLIGIVLVSSVAGAICNTQYTDVVYRALRNQQSIRKIVLRVSTAQDSDFDATILDTALLLKFNAVLRGGEKIAFDTPRMHSMSINIDIYKDRKVNIRALKTTRSGWVVAEGADWYRNDSLIQLLTPYLSANAH